MEIPHQNYDSVFKEAITLYKNKTLDFLGLTGIAPIMEPLRTESVEIEIKIELRDMTFGTQDGRGLHLENEVDLSKDDMLRFCSYNIGLNRIYKREFLTVIFVKNPTTLTEFRTKHVHFKPVIVQCSEFDANTMLDDLKKDIAAGKPVNELKLVYLPLFRSTKLSPTELFRESARLIKDLKLEDEHRQKIYALSIVLAGKVVDEAAIRAVLEEIMIEGNVIIKVIEEIGEKRGVERTQEETAKNLLDMGLDVLDIIKATGISAERLAGIRDSLSNKAI